MARDTCRVTFQPEGRSVFVLRGAKLIEAAGQAGIILSTPCGGEGTCGKCCVQVRGDHAAVTPADERRFSADELGDGMRLACQFVVEGDTVVSIPEGSRMFEQVILTEGAEHAIEHDPDVRKVCVTLDEPTVDDLRCDVDRLKDALAAEHGDVRVDLAIARQLPSILRAEDFRVTVVIRGSKVVCVESGHDTAPPLGVAFDVGTTTVVGALMDLGVGRRIGVASRTNPQVHFGDDVVSRIRHAQSHSGGLGELQQRLAGCLNDIVRELADEAGVERTAIYEATAVGNTTMTHILLGIDPSPIAQAPYVSVFRDALDIKAHECGLALHPDAELHVLPNIAGFVGSDTVGMVLAAQMNKRDEICLGIDIGTNGEIVLGNRDRVIACSTAAGPAFEGARIRCGMRATDGAISKVVVNDEIEVGVIGGGRASGICGSGLIDAVAELLRAGVIDASGRIVAAGDLPETVTPGVRQALSEVDDQPAVVLVDAARSRTGQAVVLTQKDVREVQLAKGAIWAGIHVLASELGIEPDGIPRVLLAGGFGNFIRRSNAKRIGLLPDIPTSRIEYIGNAAAVGAQMALLCRTCRIEAGEISRAAEYVELAARADFQMLFMDAMMFPSDSA